MTDTYVPRLLDQELREVLLVHTGPRVFRLAECILAVPVAGLWAATGVDNGM